MTSGTPLPHKILRPGTPLEETRLAVITVTFNPDIGKLKLQLDALPQGATSVIVDNASNEDEIAAIKHLAMQRAGTHLIQNDQNVGLAAAANAGAAYIAELSPAHDFLLLMDQDSHPRQFSIENLMSAFLQLESDGHQVGCVGPRLVDETTGLQHGFHCIYGWRWVRIFPPLESVKPVNCSNLNGGGTLVRTSLFGKLGGLDETLFIDHVDTEWAFRVLTAGYRLFGIPHATFDHGMGERGWRFWWFGWRVWPQRSPRRHYYLFRNTVRLLRRPYVPRVWKFWAVIKLFLTMTVYAIFDSRRVGQISNMVNGIRDAHLQSVDK
jgi:rhamnosyltransferase